MFLHDVDRPTSHSLWQTRNHVDVRMKSAKLVKSSIKNWTLIMYGISNVIDHQPVMHRTRYRPLDTPISPLLEEKYFANIGRNRS